MVVEERVESREVWAQGLTVDAATAEDNPLLKQVRFGFWKRKKRTLFTTPYTTPRVPFFTKHNTIKITLISPISPNSWIQDF